MYDDMAMPPLTLEHLTDPKVVEKTCKQYGIKLTRGAGQNFLVDTDVACDMVRAAGVGQADRIVEIGPGLGSLTVALAEAAGEVVAVEKDPRVCEALQLIVAPYRNVRVICGDILKIFNETLRSTPHPSPPPQGERGLHGESEEEQRGRRYKVVANLPYSITSAALRKFTEDEPRPEMMVVMVQKEVAERVCALPGEMSVLSVAVQFYGKPEIVRMVPRTAFWPEPRVDSAILRIIMRREHPFPIPPPSRGREVKGGGEGRFTEKQFFQLVKIGFSSRRKQLQNNLAAGFRVSNDEAKRWIESAGLDGKIRAQDLSVEDWGRLEKVPGFPLSRE